MNADIDAYIKKLDMPMVGYKQVYATEVLLDNGCRRNLEEWYPGIPVLLKLGIPSGATVCSADTYPNKSYRSDRASVEACYPISLDRRFSFVECNIETALRNHYRRVNYVSGKRNQHPRNWFHRAVKFTKFRSWFDMWFSYEVGKTVYPSDHLGGEGFPNCFDTRPSICSVGIHFYGSKPDALQSELLL